MRLLMALAICALAPLESQAKCARQLFELSGAVVDSNGAPMAGVVVGAAWMEVSEPAGPSMTLTDSEGRYSIPIYFNPYSGQSLFGGDRCRAVLSQVSIAAYSKTHRSGHRLLEIARDSRVVVAPLRMDAKPALGPDDARK